ncbi:NADPH-dependent F420 reductase [Lysobacter korlensis]|uniref:NADPH-dependent F420 reductase n=1 Tax=Lysobacter korlensis TaxID=553636 RepID=A0ABV6RTR9_9GAMM
MHIAILGTGHVATTLGTALLHAGHHVTFGSRTPDSVSGMPAPVLDHAGAIDGSEVVISALAAAHSVATLTPLQGSLSGRILIDVGNAVDEELNLIYSDSSLGERLQAALPGTKVVKTLNTVGAVIGVEPDKLSAPTNVFLSGDDPDAKAVVSEMLDSLGWPPPSQIDLGGIGTARAAEHYFLLFAAVLGALRTPAFNLAIVR